MPPRAVLVREVNPTSAASLVRGAQGVSAYIQPIVPQGGGQLVAASQAFDHRVEASTPFRIQTLVLDIPEDVTAHIEIDGTIVISRQDGSGLVGEIPLGAFTGGDGLAATKVRIYGTNDGSSTVDIGAWMVVA